MNIITMYDIFMNTNDIIVCLIIVLLFAIFAYIYRNECDLCRTKGYETMIERMGPVVPTATTSAASIPQSTISAANYEAIMNVASIYNDSMATFTGLTVKDNI